MKELDFLYGDVFCRVSNENTKNLLDAFYSHNLVEDFLREDNVNIPVFSDHNPACKGYNELLLALAPLEKAPPVERV